MGRTSQSWRGERFWPGHGPGGAIAWQEGPGSGGREATVSRLRIVPSAVHRSRPGFLPASQVTGDRPCLVGGLPQQRRRS